MLERLERSGAQGDCGPKLAAEQDAQYWYDQPGAPKGPLDEDPQGETVDYDELIKSWSSQ